MEEFDFKKFALYSQKDYIDGLYKAYKEYKDNSEMTDAIGCMMFIYVYLEKQYNELTKYMGSIKATDICLGTVYYLELIWGLIFKDIYWVFMQFDLYNEILEDRGIKINDKDLIITKRLYKIHEISTNYQNNSLLKKPINENFSQVVNKVENILDKLYENIDDDYIYSIGKTPQKFESLLSIIKNKIGDKPLE